MPRTKLRVQRTDPLPHLYEGPKTIDDDLTLCSRCGLMPNAACHIVRPTDDRTFYEKLAADNHVPDDMGGEHDDTDGPGQETIIAQVMEQWRELKDMKAEIANYEGMIATKRDMVIGMMKAYNLTSLSVPGEVSIYHTKAKPATDQLDIAEVQLFIDALEAMDPTHLMSVREVLTQLKGCTKKKGARKESWTIREYKEGDEDGTD